VELIINTATLGAVAKFKSSTPQETQAVIEVFKAAIMAQ
jgi:hypothetical protein